MPVFRSWIMNSRSLARLDAAPRVPLAALRWADVAREYAKDESNSTQYYVELARKRVGALE